MPSITRISEGDDYDVYETVDGVVATIYYVHVDRTFYYPNYYPSFTPDGAERPTMDGTLLDQIVEEEGLDADTANEYLPRHERGSDSDMFHDCAVAAGASTRHVSTGRGVDLHQTVTGDWVCDPCHMNYYTPCERCGLAEIDDEIQRVDGRHAVRYYCDNCVGHETSWCDECDLRYPDSEADDHAHYDDEGCDCEAYLPEFSIDAVAEDGIGRVRLDNDTDHIVGVGKEELTYSDIKRIKQYVRETLLPDESANSNVENEIRRIAVVSVWDIGYEYKTSDGTWSKRYRSWVYKRTKSILGTGYSMPAPILSEIGRRLKEEIEKPTEYTVRITRDLNRSASDLGNSDSCWWTDYHESRCALKSNHGFGFLALDSSLGNTIGRTWVLPCVWEELHSGVRFLRPTDGDATAYVVFNAYGVFEERVGARAFATMVGWKHVGTIDFNPRTMYINGTCASLILPNDDDFPREQWRVADLAAHAPYPQEETESDMSDPQSVALMVSELAAPRTTLFDTMGRPEPEPMPIPVGSWVRVLAAGHPNARHIVGKIGHLRNIIHPGREFDGVPHPYGVWVEGAPTTLVASHIEWVTEVEARAAGIDTGATTPIDERPQPLAMDSTTT